VAELASWDRPFQLWHYSVSYRRLLVRSVDGGPPERVDVLFSNVRFMHLTSLYEKFNISAPEGWAPPDGGVLMDQPGQWFVINGGQGYIHATHCQWHEDDGNAMSPSRFGPFRQTI
jgi:hypothetical protein